MSWALALLSLLTLGAIGSWYALAERTFHRWDSIFYQIEVQSLSALFHQATFPAFEAIRPYLARGTFYVSLPLVPAHLLFGPSRLIFILSLLFVYVWPVCLILGRVAVRAIPGDPTIVYWRTVFISMLATPFMEPSLLGQPEMGALLWIILGAEIYLSAPALDKLGRALALAGCLALAPLVRRPFLFCDAALFSSIVAHQVLRLWSWPQPRMPEIRALCMKLSGIAAVAGLIYGFFGWPWIQDNVLARNLYGAYLSYDSGVALWAKCLFERMGIVSLLFASLGILFWYFGTRRDAMVSSFLCLYGLSWFGIWMTFNRFVSRHYDLHFWWVGVLLLSTLAAVPPDQKATWRRRLWQLGIAAGLPVLIFVQGLTPRGWPSLPGWVLGQRVPPERRADYEEIDRLVGTLRKVAKDRPILIAASGVIDADLVRVAESSLYPTTRILRIPVTPQVDSRDWYPTGDLYRAGIVVAVSPFQHHIPAAEQKVVGVVDTAFREHLNMAEDFEELPGSYALNHGARATVFRRVRPSEIKRVIEGLAEMEAHFSRRPAGQGDWISLNALPDMARGGVELQARGTVLERGEARAIFIGKTNHGLFQGELGLSQACPGVKLGLTVLNQKGELESEKQVSYLREERKRFALPFEKNDQSYLVLTLLPLHEGSSAECRVSVRGDISPSVSLTE